MQGVRILRNEAYVWYVAMTKDEAQRRRWTFYEAVIFVRVRKRKVQMSKVLISHKIPAGFYITRLRRSKKGTITALCQSEPRTKRFVMNVCNTGK